MRTMIRSFVPALAALAGLVAADAALAQQTLVVTRDPSGTGARAELTDITPSEAAVVLGLEPPPSDDATLLLEEGLPPRWTTEPLQDIHERMGGLGPAEIVLFRDDGSGGRTPEEIAPTRETRAPTELFETPPTERREKPGRGGIQPRDGLWTAEVGEPRLEGCPPMLAGMVGGAMGSMDTPSGERRVTFSDPFDPNDLEIGAASGITWRRGDAPNVWQAQMLPEALVDAAPGARFSVDWRLVVAGEGEIHHTSSVLVALPAAALAVMGGSGECRVVTESMWLRAGD